MAKYGVIVQGKKRTVEFSDEDEARHFAEAESSDERSTIVIRMKAFNNEFVAGYPADVEHGLKDWFAKHGPAYGAASYLPRGPM